MHSIEYLLGFSLSEKFILQAVYRIRNRRICNFLDFLDPDPQLFVWIQIRLRILQSTSKTLWKNLISTVLLLLNLLVNLKTDGKYRNKPEKISFISCIV